MDNFNAIFISSAQMIFVTASSFDLALLCHIAQQHLHISSCFERQKWQSQQFKHTFTPWKHLDNNRKYNSQSAAIYNL